MAKSHFHVISHTHWDREWYLTFEQFRFRLVSLIDNLLDLLEEDEQFRVFHLDGQTIVLEDYLDIRPAQKERLERLIRDGRILIGPWYLQNDEFLTSGEATVRNLQLGIRQSRAISREMRVGYLPDQFGNISQIPQILRGFGIDNAVFGRGYDVGEHRDQEFLWEGADGSRVTAVFLPNWYNNAQRFPADPEKAYKVLRFVQSHIDKYRKTGNYLLMNGVDHLEAQENLSGILAGLSSRLSPEEEISHATLEEHIAQVKAELTEPRVHHGEMRAGDDYHILAGTLSSRVYLKQANVEALDLLEKWLEPLAAWAAGAGLGRVPADYLAYLWKELMKNHPHDSICGCSQDEVHEHMMDRFRRVEEAGEELFKQQAGLLVRQIDTEGFGENDQLLTVLNPASEPQSGWVETTVDFLERDAVSEFAILDSDNRIVHHAVLHKEKIRKQRLSPINLPTELPVDRFTIGFLAENIPGQGYASYRIVPGRTVGEEGRAPDKEIGQTSKPVLENRFLRAEIEDNGTLTVTDKTTGQTYGDWMTFVDEADGGDLYVFRGVENCGEISSVDATAAVRLLHRSDEMTRYEIAIPLVLPAGLASARDCRSDSRLETMLRATVSLAKESRHLDIRLDLDNQARDHRLRVRFPLPEQAEASWAGGQFDVVKRQVSAGREYKRDANSQPNWKWVAAGGGQGAAVFNRGLHEYELRAEGRWLDVTLLRGVGTIFGRSSDALPHENDDNPLGQCPGRHGFEFAIRPFGPGDRPAKLAREAEAWHHGLRAVAVPVREDKWAQGRPWVQESEIAELFVRPDPNEGKPKLPRTHGFVRLSGPGVVLSAVKRHLDREACVIRFYNAEDTPTPAVLSLDRPIRSARRANLLEEPIGELQLTNHEVRLEAGPKEIVTLILET